MIGVRGALMTSYGHYCFLHALPCAKAQWSPCTTVYRVQQLPARAEAAAHAMHSVPLGVAQAKKLYNTRGVYPRQHHTRLHANLPPPAARPINKPLLLPSPSTLCCAVLRCSRGSGHGAELGAGSAGTNAGGVALHTHGNVDGRPHLGACRQRLRRRGEGRGVV